MEHSVEQGDRVMIDGKAYWVTKITHDSIEFMAEPDSKGRLEDPPKGSFWPIFWCIVLIAVLIKLIF